MIELYPETVYCALLILLCALFILWAFTDTANYYGSQRSVLDVHAWVGPSVMAAFLTIFVALMIGRGSDAIQAADASELQAEQVTSNLLAVRRAHGIR